MHLGHTAYIALLTTSIVCGLSCCTSTCITAYKYAQPKSEDGKPWRFAGLPVLAYAIGMLITFAVVCTLGVIMYTASYDPSVSPLPMEHRMRLPPVSEQNNYNQYESNMQPNDGDFESFRKRPRPSKYAYND